MFYIYAAAKNENQISSNKLETCLVHMLRYKYVFKYLNCYVLVVCLFKNLLHVIICAS